MSIAAFAAIAPSLFASADKVRSLKPVLLKMNDWAMEQYGDVFLEVNWTYLDSLKFKWDLLGLQWEAIKGDLITENPLYQVAGGGAVVQPNPFRPFFPGYGTVWIERLADVQTFENIALETNVIGSKRFALHPEVELD